MIVFKCLIKNLIHRRGIFKIRKNNWFIWLVAVSFFVLSACKQNAMTTNKTSSNDPQTLTQTLQPKAETPDLDALKIREKNLESIIAFLKEHKRVLHGISPSVDQHLINATLKQYQTHSDMVLEKIGHHAKGTANCLRFLSTYNDLVDDLNQLNQRLAQRPTTPAKQLNMESRSLVANDLLSQMVGVIVQGGEGGMNNLAGGTYKKCIENDRDQWVQKNIDLLNTAKQLHLQFFGIPGLNDSLSTQELNNMANELKEAVRRRNQLIFDGVFLVVGGVAFAQIFKYISTKGIPYVAGALALGSGSQKALKWSTTFGVFGGEAALYLYVSDSIFGGHEPPTPGLYLSDWDQALALTEQFNESELNATELYLVHLARSAPAIADRYAKHLNNFESHIDMVLKTYDSVDQALFEEEKKLKDVQEKLQP